MFSSIGLILVRSSHCKKWTWICTFSVDFNTLYHWSPPWYRLWEPSASFDNYMTTAPICRRGILVIEYCCHLLNNQKAHSMTQHSVLPHFILLHTNPMNAAFYCHKYCMLMVRYTGKYVPTLQWWLCEQCIWCLQLIYGDLHEFPDGHNDTHRLEFSWVLWDGIHT